MASAAISSRRGARSLFLLRSVDRATLVRTLAAAILGGGVAASGFPPLASASDVLEVGLEPWRVVLTPAVLLGLGALATAWVFPRGRVARRGPASWLALAACLLTLGAATSLLRSDDVWYSVLVGILALLAPCAVAFGVARSTLAPRLLAGAFLAVTALALLRADVQFLRLDGLPTSSTLFAAKFRDQPYDFHYYTLGNPDGTAAFLLLPFGLALFWLAQRRGGARMTALLALSLAISSFTMVLAYSRSALVWCLALVCIALAQAPLTRRRRTAVASCVAVLTVAGAAALGPHYLLNLSSSGQGSSGAVRLGSIAEALPLFESHPLTGFGLGMYNTVDGYLPAHSAIVQAAVELGLLGLLGAISLLGASLRLVWSHMRASARIGPSYAAALSAASYLLYCAFTGGASEALYSGYLPVWGLSVGLLLGLGVSGAATDGVPPEGAPRDKAPPSPAPTPSSQSSARIAATRASQE